MAVVSTIHSATTTTATPEVIYVSPTAFTGAFVFNIAAVDGGSGNEKIWTIHASRSDNDNSVAAAASVQITDDSSTGVWSVEVAEGTDALEVTITGDAGITILWYCSVERYSS